MTPIIAHSHHQKNERQKTGEKKKKVFLQTGSEKRKMVQRTRRRYEGVSVDLQQERTRDSERGVQFAERVCW